MNIWEQIKRNKERLARGEKIATDNPKAKDNPLYRVEVIFVPRAVVGNTLTNLELVGTKCFYRDETYERLNALKCDRYYPAGSLVPMTDAGNIRGEFTWSDIGQLDYAFNDYLNFLMDLRRIYEPEGNDSDKFAAVIELGRATGRQGHAHSVFVDKHGGEGALLRKCRGFHP